MEERLWKTAPAHPAAALTGKRGATIEPDHQNPGAGPLTALLELERIERDLFRADAITSEGVRGHLFGGRVAAQALRAAMLTINDRVPHSMHSYFLQAGRTDIPTVLRVHRDRDGRTLSARRVTAIQNGEVIFTLSASFTECGESGPEYEAPAGAAVPPPAACDAIVHPDHPGWAMCSSEQGEHTYGIPDWYWARPVETLPHDPAVHACVLTYLTDMGIGDAPISHQVRDMRAPTVDHAVWFHRQPWLDDHVLLAMDPVSAGAGRLLYRGSVRGSKGELLATFMQECLLRPFRTPASSSAVVGLRSKVG